MPSWVYLFSKFTPEALLFEGITICVLVALYTGFFVLRKRRYGVIEKDVPKPVVQGYLNQLMNDAHSLRAQLFGLLSDAGVTFTPQPLVQGAAPVVSATPSPVPTVTTEQIQSAAPIIASDPELQKKLTELQNQLNQQVQATNTITGEKKKLEEQLAAAKANAGAGGGEGADPAELDTLKKKIAELEGRLAEYSVIEDDLANLKRLQQENAELKKQLGGAAPAVAAPAAEAATEDEAPAAAEAAEAKPDEDASAEADAAEPEVEAAAEAEAPTDTPTQDPEVPPAETPAEAAAQGAGNEAFEGLVDQVEESLDASGEDAASAEAAADSSAEASSSDEASESSEGEEAPAEGGDGDDDLLNEFEKMLNS